MATNLSTFIEDKNVSVKKPLAEKLSEQDLFPMLREMGNTETSILKYQKNRVASSIVLFLIGCIAALIFRKYWWIALAGLGITVAKWMLEYRGVKKMYQNFDFNRQLVFNKFIRLLIPMLMQPEATIYTVLSKMHDRPDIVQGQVKDALERFLINLNDDSKSDKPYVQFAQEASGTDRAMLFMTTLYDYVQSSNDLRILQSLGRMNSEEVNSGMDDIVEYKLRRFFEFPTKVAMSSLILVFGYAIAVIVNEVSKFHIGG